MAKKNGDKRGNRITSSGTSRPRVADGLPQSKTRSWIRVRKTALGITFGSVWGIVVGLATVSGLIGGLIYWSGRVAGIPLIVITPNATLVVWLRDTPSGEVQLELSTNSVLIDNRGLGNTAITGVFLSAQFSSGDPLLASTNDEVRCLSSQQEILSLPIPVPAADAQFQLVCSMTRTLTPDRFEQLSGGIRSVQFDFVREGGKAYTIRYCVERDASFWQRLVSDPRPTNRDFLDSLCEG